MCKRKKNTIFVRPYIPCGTCLLWGIDKNGNFSCGVHTKPKKDGTCNKHRFPSDD